MEYRLKKSLGQHFLVNEAICKNIVAAVLQHSPKQVLEVGPGAGALTKYLIQQPDMVLKAVELDTEKVGYLLEYYPQLQNSLINESILTTKLPFTTPFAVVGNFPYNISTEIVFKMLEWREHITSVTGMFQKEVALRLAAKHGSKTYGVTSVLVQAFFEVNYLFDVSPQNFNPPPKVDSGVLQLIPLAQPIVMHSYKRLSQLVKAAFNQRRKTMRNACKSLFLPEALQQPLFSLRAEQLSVAQFAALTYTMQ